MTQADEAASATEPVHEPQADSQTGPQATPHAGAAAAAPKRESLVDAFADLLQMAVNWLRAEASDIVRDKLVLPVQQLGMTLASAIAAAILLVIGLCLIFVAVLMLLAKWLTWPGAFGLVGALILIAAGVFTALKVRSIQK